MWCYRIPPLSKAVWSSNCLVEGGSNPLGLEEKSLKNGISHHWISESRARTHNQYKPNQCFLIFLTYIHVLSNMIVIIKITYVTSYH